MKSPANNEVDIRALRSDPNVQWRTALLAKALTTPSEQPDAETKRAETIHSLLDRLGTHGAKLRESFEASDNWDAAAAKTIDNGNVDDLSGVMA